MANDNQKVLQQNALTSAGQTRTLSLLQAQLALIQQSGADTSLADTSAKDGERYLVFSLQDCELAVKAGLVQAVERLVDVTPVPHVAPWVKGVANLRGSILSVVDLRMFLGLEQLTYSSRSRLLSLQQGEMAIGFLVDAVSEMLFVPTSSIVRSEGHQAAVPHWTLPYATGHTLLNTRVVVLLDATLLLLSDKMQRYEVQGTEAL